MPSNRFDHICFPGGTRLKDVPEHLRRLEEIVASTKYSVHERYELFSVCHSREIPIPTSIRMQIRLNLLEIYKLRIDRLKKLSQSKSKNRNEDTRKLLNAARIRCEEVEALINCSSE